MRETRNRKMFHAEVTIDGENFYEGPASCVLVGNTGSLKGGIKAFPDASPTDGRLHVAVVTAAGVREWAQPDADSGTAQAAVVGQRGDRRGHRDHGEVRRKRPFELDGGVKGKAKKLEFEIRPRSLVVCAPSD